MPKEGAKLKTKFTEKKKVLKIVLLLTIGFRQLIEACQIQSELLRDLLDFGCFPLFL